MVSGALAVTVVASRVRGASLADDAPRGNRLPGRRPVVVAATRPVGRPAALRTDARGHVDRPLAGAAPHVPRLPRPHRLGQRPRLGAPRGDARLACGRCSPWSATFGGTERRSSAWRPLFFLVAPWCCVLASPYGTDVIAYYRLLLVDSPVSKYITEWQAPGLHGYFLVFFAVAAATVVIAVWQRRRLLDLRPRRAGTDARRRAPERPRRRLVLARAGDAAAGRARRHRAAEPFAAGPPAGRARSRRHAWRASWPGRRSSR